MKEKRNETFSKNFEKVVYACINEHALLLSGTEDRMHGSIDGYFLEANGVNYVDRNDKSDRKKTVAKMRKDFLCKPIGISD